jgi:hypothetical protein
MTPGRLAGPVHILGQVTSTESPDSPDQIPLPDPDQTHPEIQALRAELASWVG